MLARRLILMGGLWSLIVTGPATPALAATAEEASAAFEEEEEPLPFPQATVPIAAEAGAGLVWQVEGGRTRIFLAGSVHLGSAAVGAAWPTELEFAWTHSRRVFFEVNPRDVNRPAQAAAVRRAGALPAGQNLWHRLPSTTAVLLDRSVSSQVLRNQLAPMRPWMAALTLHEATLLGTGVTRDDGLEAVMFRRAQRDRKEVGGLISPIEQVHTLASLSFAQEIAFLHSTLESLPTSRRELDAMTNAWRRGDGAWLEKNVARAFEGQPDFYERFMGSRNRRWASVISSLAEDSRPVLVVVGCLHLAGPDNLRQCLAKRGFTVTPLHLRKAAPTVSHTEGRSSRLSATLAPAALQPTVPSAPPALSPRVNFPVMLAQPDPP